MLTVLLRNAVIAGLLSGLLFTTAQVLYLVPLILEAEFYEEIAAHEREGNKGFSSLPSKSAHGDNHVWSPQLGWERNLYTALSNVALGFSVSLMIGAALIYVPKVCWWHGVLWGLAGFTAFHAAPSIIYPPTLPGTEEAHLIVRQLWWIAAIEASLFGLSFAVFSRQYLYKGMGILLLLAPHVVGGPPGTVISIVPDALSTRFILTSSVLNSVFWIFLGVVTTTLFYFSARTAHPDNKLR